MAFDCKMDSRVKPEDNGNDSSLSPIFNPAFRAVHNIAQSADGMGFAKGMAAHDFVGVFYLGCFIMALGDEAGDDIDQIIAF